MEKRYAHLSSQERERIAIGVAQGQSARAIARALCRSNSSISREIQRNTAEHYSGVIAHEMARHRLRKARRPARLHYRGLNNGLWCNVVRQLRRGLSPQQTACRLKARHPNQPEFWVSHQTIYRAIYLLPRGELKRELMDCLRRDGRPYKQPGASSQSRRRWIEHLITERPVEAEDRLTLGHWEGDLVIGQGWAAAGSIDTDLSFHCFLELYRTKVAQC